MPEGADNHDDKAAAEAALVEKARAMASTLAMRARDAELNRRISEQTDADFRDAGFYRALQPARYGGIELDYGAQTAFARELGRGCASSGWVAGILACHGWVGGMFPDETQSEFWSEDPDAAIATSFLPVGVSVERKGDCLVIGGRWRFSSGVDHCRWAILLAMVPPEGGEGPPNPVFAVVDLNDCTIEDTWKSAGLAATGSNDIVIGNANIPPHRIMRVTDLRGDETPGSVANDSYLYRLNLGHVAQSCCDAVDELLPLTSGRGLEKSHPMQRAWRDVHAVSQHIGLVWDLQTGLYGNVLLGHGSPDPKL